MNENAPPSLNIRLLGDFRLDHGDTPLTGVNTPRLQSLLAYLLLHRDAPQSRAHLAFQFWPDSTDAQARSNLRTLLHRLRHALPDDATYLNVDAQTVQWHPDAPAAVDVINFEDALAQAEDTDDTTARNALELAANLCGGDLLLSCYDDWILPHRERLRQAHLRALERLTRLLEDHRDYDAAIGHARSILRLDPLHEAATRRLMHLHALKGDRAGALRAYHACATALQRELGVEPSPAT
jgi:DNA-binding SARP family transcriptional activator